MYSSKQSIHYSLSQIYPEAHKLRHLTYSPPTTYSSCTTRWEQVAITIACIVHNDLIRKAAPRLFTEFRARHERPETDGRQPDRIQCQWFRWGTWSWQDLLQRALYQGKPVWQKDRIKAHFLTCYIALMVCRILEKKLKQSVPVQTY